MRALFLGNVAADTAEGIRAELPAGLEVEILDPIDPARLPQAAAEADILVSNHWRADYPPAPKVRLVQSVATGVELFDLSVLPKGALVCNAFGHETAIAEYIVMVWLALHHRLFEISGEFRERGSWRTSWVESGAPHGEVRGSTLGIVGYGRVGREVARRAAPFGCRILAANRTPREPDAGVERIFPLAELDRMLPLCDTVALCTALGPETTGLIDARRLALMKPTAFLINIARGQVIDEDAVFAALRDHTIGGAALDVWWQYPNPAEPLRRGSRHPFHELPNVIVTPHNSGWTQGNAAALGRDRRQYRALRARRARDQRRHHDLKGAEMKVLFLGRFASGHAPRIVARLTTAPDTEILADDTDATRLAAALAEADAVVGLEWRVGFPPAPRLRLLQCIATGVDRMDLAAVPRGVAVCNTLGHETPIAEYVIMTMLNLTHRLFHSVLSFRAGSWEASLQGGGTRHGELLGQTVGIVGYGGIGREVARRAAPFGVRLLAANRSPIEDAGAVERVYPLAELDRMLPECDVVVIAAALAPETKGLIDARRIALMKPGALLINIARGQIVDEEALYAALRDGRLGGAAIDVWWRYPTPAEPQARPSRFPFHELPNVLMTPHSSSYTEGTAERRFGAIIGNIDRLARGEPLINVVTVT